jgi:hypothetical protein
MSDTLKKINDIIEDIDSSLINKLSVDESYNFAPVLHKVLPKHSDVKLYCKIKTSDNSENGIINYLTFWRSPNYAVAHDGVGLAWTKGDGNLYNFYIVDNDPLSDGVFITEKIVRESVGINNFIAGGKFNINKDIWYNTSLKINSNYSIIAKIWVDGTTEPADNAAPNTDYLIIKSGAMIHPFRTGNEWEYHFGIGIQDTSNYEWEFDELKIINLKSGYPYAIFRLNSDSIYFNDEATLDYYGYAVDSNNNYGLEAFILNSGNEWESIGINSGTESDDVINTLIRKEIQDISDYRQPSGDCYVAAKPVGTYGMKSVNTHYIGLTNMIPSGVQMGNVTDIWVESVNKILDASSTVSAIDGIINIDTNNFVLPIQEILDITDVTNTILSRGEWELISDPDTIYSTKAVQKIKLNSGTNATYTVNYRYYSDGVAVQNLVESENFRSPGSDNLIRISPPHAVEIRNLEYTGNIVESELKNKIIYYINNLDKSLILSDFYKYLGNSGVSYFDNKKLNIVIRGYNYKGLNITNFEEIIKDKYTIEEDIGSFYCGSYDIKGMVRLNG